VAASVATAAAAAYAQSQQTWPTRPVRLVVPLPPGSGIDLVARSYAQKMTLAWGQPVVVDNRPGANTIVANESVAHAASDGYTLLFGLGNGFTVNPHLYARLPYDPVKDFAPIILLTAFSVVLVAHPSVPANDVAGLVELARARPGQVTYGSIGSGSEMHLLSEMLGNKAGIKLVHVPYKGIPQMTTAVLSGEVQLAWVGVFTSKPLVQSGRLKALGYSGAKRAPLMPEVPTLAEQGYPEVQMSAWFGLLAPAGTPRALIERIYADTAKLLADPGFRDKELLARAYEPSGLGPEEFAAYMRKESADYAVMVKISGARVE
jgi:tripartite-type tricarboxylate transporter receptor subunit TctC